MATVNLKINNIPVTVEEGTTILEAAKQVGIRIPTLCYMKDINEIGACRICVVEVKGARSLVASCVFPVSEGMEVLTSTPNVMESRRTTLELIISAHNKKCLSCVRDGNCELQALSAQYGVDSNRFEGGKKPEAEVDESTPYLIRDQSKCILCRRCVAVCKQRQHVSVIGPNERGFNTHIGTAFEKELKDVPCIACGQCIKVCPVGALRERDYIDEVFAAIANPAMHVVVGTAPSVRVGLGDEFDFPVGTNVEGKMVAALRRLGFDAVFDVNFTADLTIMEEGTELLHRLKEGKPLPLITSCSPGWIKFCEHYYPEFLPNLSSCKSPQQMFGAVAKTYYAEKMGIDPSKIFVVSIMPCTAKKFEMKREGESASGYPDIDVAITTREIARMIKRAGIMFDILPDEQFDAPFGIGSGAGVIFGATGGVMEAALRTVAEIMTGKPLENLDFTDVRGTQGIKEATYNLAGTEVRVAVASGIANAKLLLEKIKAGEKYHFVEIMACPGGCVSGGGQPFKHEYIDKDEEIRKIRAQAVYTQDKGQALRKSHENPAIKEIYDTYFGEPGSHKAHEYLHTHYVARPKYK